MKQLTTLELIGSSKFGSVVSLSLTRQGAGMVWVSFRQRLNRSWTSFCNRHASFIQEHRVISSPYRWQVAWTLMHCEYPGDQISHWEINGLTFSLTRSCFFDSLPWCVADGRVRCPMTVSLCNPSTGLVCLSEWVPIESKYCALVNIYWHW